MDAHPNRNVELKARCQDLARIRDRAQSLGATYEATMHQVDTYFRTVSGRLKLRETAGQPAELIGYHRPDTAVGRTCRYRRNPISQPSELKQTLVETLGLRGVVTKRRELWLWRNVRIHLDEVVGLGSFLELEAVLEPDMAEVTGEELLAELVRHFEIPITDLVPISNIDQLEEMAP